MASQIRVVLNPELKPLADEIKQVTGCGSTSEVVALLLTRYGKHFIAWWLSNPHQNDLAAISVPSNDFTIPTADIDLSTPIEL